MATLTVPVSTDFSGQAVFAIDTIDFTNPVFAATATFAGGQFDNLHISTSVLIDGSGPANRLQVNVTGGLFSARTWGFANWTDGSDTVTLSFIGASAAAFAGSSRGDSITGGSLGDTLSGLAGNDVLNGGAGNDILNGGAGADVMNGGIGNDTFRYAAATDIASGEIASGNAGIGDAVEVQAAGAYNFGTMTLASIETLRYGAAVAGSVQAVTLSPDQMNALLAVAGNADTVNQLSVTSSSINLSAKLFTNWTPGQDTLRITGTGIGDFLTGSNQDDILLGGLGNDLIDGFTGSDTADYSTATTTVAVNLGNAAAQNTGGAGTDTLAGIENAIGGSGNDSLTGNAGANLLDGGGGADTLTGGAGDDTYFADAATDNINELSGGGIDTVFAATDFTLAAEVENLTLTGDGFIDGIGNTGDNSITGNGNNNELRGGAGRDTLLGGGGLDTFTIAAGEFVSGEIVDGGAGIVDQIVLLSAGTVFFSGEAVTGIEKLTFAAGTSQAIFSAGQVGTGGVTAFDGAADGALTVLGPVVDLSSLIFKNWTLNDEITIENSKVVDGTLVGSSQRDTILGFIGDTDDALTGGGGVDTLRGRGGNDTYVYVQGADIVADELIDDSGGADDSIAILGDGTFLLNSLSVSGVERLSFGDVAASVKIAASQIGAADRITAVEGNGAGTGALGVAVIGAAIDLSAVSFTAWDQALDVVNLIGTAAADSLTGSGVADRLDGFTGADGMAGGFGADTYAVDNAGDVVTEALSAGFDSIETTLLNLTLAANVEQLKFTGAGNFTGKGNDLSNKLFGGAANDLFIADGVGNDQFQGLEGFDTLDFRLFGGATVNLIDQSLNAGSAAGDLLSNIERIFGSIAGADILTGGNREAFYSGFGGNDALTGGANADTLNGGDGADVLTGNANSDVLNGGRNNDTMAGGASNDTFLFAETIASGGFGSDTITDFQDGLDKLKFDDAVAADFAAFTLTGNGSTAVTVSLDGNNKVILQSVSAVTVSAADFVFF